MYNFGFSNGVNEIGLPYSNNIEGISPSFEFLFRNKPINRTIQNPIDYINVSEKFIYILDFSHKVNFSSIDIATEVVEYAKKGYAKICIMLFSEPFSSELSDEVNLLALRYKLNKDCLYFVTGDLIAKNKESDLFSFISFNYFLSTPWFVDRLNFTPFTVNPSKLRFKFLSLNRVPRRQRYIFLYEILHRPSLFFNTLLSFGDLANKDVLSRDKKQMFNATHVNQLLNDAVKSRDIEKFFRDRVVGIDIDAQDKSINLAAEFDLDLYQRTFCSIVSESSVEETKLFFSEKTSKPLFAKQPFLFIGNPNSLKKLHELGFKTFSKWWDESYDSELNFGKRQDMVFDVMEELNKKSLVDLQQMLLDMEETLEHNHKVFLGLDYTFDFLNTVKPQ